MFGFKKQKPKTTAIALLELGWNDFLIEQEKETVRSTGLNMNDYQGEIIMINLFAAFYGFRVWAESCSLTNKEIKEIAEEFWSRLAASLKNNSDPEGAFALIHSRFKAYEQALAEDQKKSAEGAMSAELSWLFQKNVAGDQDISLETKGFLSVLGLSASGRVPVGIDGAIKILNEIYK